MMKTTRSFVLAVGFISVTSSAYATDWNWNTSKLTNESYDNYSPQLNDNGWAVWYSANTTNTDVFLYDTSAVSKLTSSSYDASNPQLNNINHVVWEGRVGGSGGDIYFYNGTSASKVTDDAYYDGEAQINDSDHIAWQRGPDGNIDGHDIFFNNGTTSQISSGAYFDLYPRINNSDQITWISQDGYDGEVKLYSAGTTTTLTNDNASDGNSGQLRINTNGLVIWTKDVSGGPVYLYNGSLVTPLPDTGYEADQIQINSAGKVVYRGVKGADSDIFLYDGSSTSQITFGGKNYSPQIDGAGHLVWYGSDGHDDEIYYFDGVDIHQVTNNDYSDILPSVGGSRLAWMGRDGANYQIFYSRPVVVTPEPSSMALFGLGAGALAFFRRRKKS